jgi:hypothetical protein
MLFAIDIPQTQSSTLALVCSILCNPAEGLLIKLLEKWHQQCIQLRRVVAVTTCESISTARGIKLKAPAIIHIDRSGGSQSIGNHHRVAMGEFVTTKSEHPSGGEPEPSICQSQFDSVINERVERDVSALIQQIAVMRGRSSRRHAQRARTNIPRKSSGQLRLSKNEVRHRDCYDTL